MKGPSDNLSPVSPSHLTVDDFQLLRVIGRGSFGKVLLVRGKRDKRVYALKILLKSQVVAKNQVEHTKSERKILEEMDYPFLCKLEFAFQTDDKLYLGMPFLSGGPLFNHLQQVGVKSSLNRSVGDSRRTELAFTVQRSCWGSDICTSITSFTGWSALSEGSIVEI